MKFVTIPLTQQTYEKLEELYKEYVEERKLAAEEYERNGDFELAEPLLKESSLEEMLAIVLTRYAAEKNP